MSTIRLHPNLSTRGRRFATGLSSAAYLVTCGHTPVRFTRWHGRISIVFEDSAKIREDAERYQQTIDRLVAKASGRC